MAGLHFSPFLPPFPGVGVCKAMSADTCPYGGADTHIITEYLPPEMQEMLLGDPPIYPPKSAINKALEASMSTAGTRMFMKFINDRAKPQIMNNYIAKSVSGSRRRAKTAEGKMMIQAMRGKAGANLMMNSFKKFKGKYGDAEGMANYEEFTKWRTENIEQEDARKLALDEFLTRKDAPSNSGPRNAAERKRKEEVRDAKQAKYDKKLREYQALLDRGVPVEKLEGKRNELRKLAPKKTGNEYMKDKVHKASLVKETSVTVTKKDGSQENIDFLELSEKKSLVKAYNDSVEAANDRLAYIMSISENPAIKDGTGIGNEISLVHEGRRVNVKFNYNKIDTDKLDALPKKVRDSITKGSSTRINIEGWDAALANGDITQEEYDLVTQDVSEINYLSPRLDAQAQEEVGVKFTPPVKSRSVNRVKDVRSTLNDVCRDFAVADKAFKEKSGGKTAKELNKEVLAGSKAIKDHMADEYAPGMSLIMGTSSSDVGTNIVQSSRRQSAAKSVQTKVFGPRLDTLMRTYGTSSASYDFELMKEKFSPEELKEYTYTSAEITTEEI